MCPIIFHFDTLSTQILLLPFRLKTRFHFRNFTINYLSSSASRLLLALRILEVSKAGAPAMDHCILNRVQFHRASGIILTEFKHDRNAKSYRKSNISSPIWRRQVNKQWITAFLFQVSVSAQAHASHYREARQCNETLSGSVDGDNMNWQQLV
uniref:Uncharacterized protein LOC104230735 n=1 Tax=Nicotiana sylvestris TaxID=4096 RepID=A0A1U7WTJ1_NICSY|nr:PREDICTED: uncharacterized protein LOC104230735 [Nicotiana sylvestris]